MSEQSSAAIGGSAPSRTAPRAPVPAQAPRPCGEPGTPGAGGISLAAALGVTLLSFGRHPAGASDTAAA